MIPHEIDQLIKEGKLYKIHFKTGLCTDLFRGSGTVRSVAHSTILEKITTPIVSYINKDEIELIEECEYTLDQAKEWLIKEFGKKTPGMARD